MSKDRQSTSILRNCYNSRGLMPHGFSGSNKNLVIEPDGTLWALLATRPTELQLRRSTNDGFSWEMVNDDRFTGSTLRGTNTSINGSIEHVTVFPNWNKIALWFGSRTATPDFELGYAVADLDADLTDNSEWTDYQPVQLDVDEIEEGVFTITSNSLYAFIVYKDGSDQMACSRWNAAGPSAVSTPDKVGGVTFKAPFDALATEDGKVHTIVPVGTTLYHIYYDHELEAWDTTLYAIDTLISSGTLVDPSLAIDGYGTLLAVWGERDNAGVIINLRIALSDDEGVTWSVTDIAKTTDFIGFTDDVKGQLGIRCDAVGGKTGGFLFTYTMENDSNISKSYVREITTTDGSTYSLGDEQEVAPVGSTVEVAGAKFFKPPGASLLSIEDKSEIRMAYQIGQGNSTLQTDTIPVHFDSEILKYSAYPSELSSESSSYTLDTAGAAELLVNIEVVAGPTENIDFYDKGMIGRKTELFMAAFDKLSTECRVLQYEPVTNSEMSDITAYEEPLEHCVDMVWDPLSYAFPTPDLTTTQQEDFVEQDIRKVFLRPNFHLSRTFLLNEGNFLKRTVWTVAYDGNDYEISQVIPHFMDDEICYYEANAYVIGPSRNPWSRTVLPSET